MGVKILKRYPGIVLSDEKYKFIYDKKSERRPAWILVEGLPLDTSFIRVSLGEDKGKQSYRVYLSSRVPLFLPLDYTPEEMKIFYDKFSEIYDSHVIKNNLPVINLLLDAIKLPVDAKVLDLGAGTGLVSGALVKRGFKDITLLDYSKGMLAKARKRKDLKGCKFVQQDSRKLHLTNGEYDIVVSVFSFGSTTYFEEKEMSKLWEKVARVMKPGGIFLIGGELYLPPSKLFKVIKKGNHDITGRGDLCRWYVLKRR